MDKQKYDFGPAIELVKNIGVVAGGLGSLAVLFFWIGNAIIVARLREYNLYGIVHYTDEYVKEAGYQFLQDVFTFFQSWPLILLFMLATGLVISLIPVGPFSPAAKSTAKPDFSVQAMTKNPFITHRWAKHIGIHYALFLGLALFAGVSLTAPWGIKNLTSAIIRQERLLTLASDSLRKYPLLFLEKKSVNADEFERRFYSEVTAGIPERGWKRLWLEDALSDLGYHVSSKETLRDLIIRFQKDFYIPEMPDFFFTGDFEQSATYRVVRNLLINKNIIDKLRGTVRSTLSDVRALLGGYLTSEEDVASLVIIPANYRLVNDSLQKLTSLKNNILGRFDLGNKETVDFMDDLSKIEPIHFGSMRLSYSFWVLIGLMAYLMLNVPRLMAFSQWEKGYFTLMLLLFLVIAITLPTAYGRYKFEFNVQKLSDLKLTAEANDEADHTVKKKFDELWKSKATLYILGPTRGQEIIVGAVKDAQDPQSTVAQIMMLDRSLVRFMVVEPVNAEDIPEIIKMLRQRRPKK